MDLFDQKIFGSLVVRKFDSEDDVCKELASHAFDQNSDGSPKWLFRGQQQQHPREYPPEDVQTGKWTVLKKHSLKMESLVPTDYREMEREIANGRSRDDLGPTHGQRISDVRSLLTTYVMQCHSKWYSGAVEKWYETLPKPDKAAKLLSIGQHYGLRTCYMDVTFDCQVAIWFATHNWNTGDYTVDGEAVIYVFGNEKLAAAATKANQAIGSSLGPRPCGVVDIRDTPAELAPRARTQRGGSIIGLEHPEFLHAAIREKAIECWTFPRGKSPASYNSLQKQQLVPPCDEMANLFQGLYDVRNWSAAQRWVNQNYHGTNATCADFDNLFA